jgi:hypothetical protein
MGETQVITGPVRFSYAHVHEAHAVEEGQAKKYSVSILIPKSDTVTVSKIQAAIKSALEAGKAKFGGKIPVNYKNPLRDGDTEREDDDNYAGHFFVNANSSKKPGIVDATGVKEIMSEEVYQAKIRSKSEVEVTKIDEERSSEEFYSGCFGKASVNFYAFNVSGNKGIACGLNNLQKLEDGENLGGAGTTAAQDFGATGEDDLG